MESTDVESNHVSSSTTLQEERYQKLRAATLAAWHHKPDANIKKNTGFVRKCRASLAADMLPQLRKDVETLKLEKYIGEIVAAILEGGIFKCRFTPDVNAAVDIICLLHCRFPDTFTPQFIPALVKQLAPPVRAQLQAMSAEQRERQETTRLARQRILLRILVELWLVGVLYGFDARLPMLTTHAKYSRLENSLMGGLGATPRCEELQASYRAILGDGQLGVLAHMAYQLFYLDQTSHLSLTLALGFTKWAPYVFQTPPDPPSDADDFTVMFLRQCKAIAQVFTAYYQSLCRSLTQQHKLLRKLARKNESLLLNRGTITEEEQQQYGKARVTFTKALEMAALLAEATGEKVPEFPDDDGDQFQLSVSFGLSGNGAGSQDSEDGDGEGLWEDEDTRDFYEKLLDLRTRVPGIFLADKASKRESSESDHVNVSPSVPTSKSPGVGSPEISSDEMATEAITMESVDAKCDEFSIQENELELDIEPENLNPVPQGDDESKRATPTVDSVVGSSAVVTASGSVETRSTTAPLSQKTGSTSSSGELQTMLNSLPLLANREMIDQAAVNFCFLNTKNARRRLSEALLVVPRRRYDLVPYYARLVATLHPYIPELGIELIQMLEQRFRKLTFARMSNERSRGWIENRVCNVMFLAELTKFRVAPGYVPMYCLKVLLRDFTNASIEVLCRGLLEPSGRYLYRSPQTHRVMMQLLDMLKRKAMAIHLDSRLSTMLDNAYYMCNPPKARRISEKPRTVMEKYIHYLLYQELRADTFTTVYKLLRKLDWDDPLVASAVFNCFTKVWKVKYHQVEWLAKLLKKLATHHPEFSTAVVDEVLENIRQGLEQNVFKHNQRRMACVQYLGDMFACKIVSIDVVFDTLYTILTLGYPDPHFYPGRYSPLDLPHDFFRVRLCCCLLDTCGVYFTTPQAQSKIGLFLLTLELYVRAKPTLPIEIEFLLDDTLTRTCRGYRFHASYDEVATAYCEKLGALHQSTGPMATAGQGISDTELGMVVGSDVESTTSNTTEEPRGVAAADPSGSGDEDDRVVPDVEPSCPTQYTDEDEDDDNATDLVELCQQREALEALRKAEGDELDQELRRIVAESVEERKQQSQANGLDVAIPLGLQEKHLQRDPRPFVSYTVLGKKGNKAQLRTLQVPSDSALVTNTISKQQAAFDEHQQLKQMVLDYEYHSHERERVELQRTLAHRGIRLTYRQSGKQRDQGRG
ncbi:mRNA decay protein [Dispira simplex]|nr:mRNA decay protein [Dispira simplex]